MNIDYDTLGPKIVFQTFSLLLYCVYGIFSLAFIDEIKTNKQHAKEQLKAELFRDIFAVCKYPALLSNLDETTNGRVIPLMHFLLFHSVFNCDLVTN